MARASSSSSDSSSNASSQIRQIVGDFVSQLSALIEHDAVSRARETILSAFTGSEGASLTVNGKRRGRPPGPRAAVLALTGTLSGTVGRKRRKAPIQLCPVPGCSNRAAPVFGMVCAKHKDLPKAEIRKFREARRAKRDKASGNGPVTAKAKRTRPRSNGKAKPTRSARRIKPAKPAKSAKRSTRSVRKPRPVPPPVAAAAATPAAS